MPALVPAHVPVFVPADVLAHGLGGRSDLPLDASAAMVGGGAAVAASFLALTAVWQRPRLRPDQGRPLPAWLARALDSPALLLAGRLVALAVTLAVVVVAFAGPGSDRANLAPWALYVTFWVGLVPASVLLGPVWRRVNPLRTLHAVLCRITGHDPRGSRALPVRLGYWPAAVWLVGFTWLELVAPNRSDPRLVGALILGYAAVNLGLAWVYGTAWFAGGDGFEVYSTLLARMCPIGRAPDSTLVLRTPLTGLVGLPARRSAPGQPPDDRCSGADGRGGEAEPGLTAVACALIGSTGFDGITRTTYWRDHVDPGSIPAGTLGLAAAIAAVAGLYLAAMRATAALTGLRGREARAMPGRFAATLLPIALGYTLAHYFSYFLIEGQMTVILASDPFGTGADLLGSTGHQVDGNLVGPTLIALVQVNAIVLGHIAATIAAHDLALRSAPAGPPGSAARSHRPGGALRTQLPMAAVMVTLTCAGLFALLSG